MSISRWDLEFKYGIKIVERTLNEAPCYRVYLRQGFASECLTPVPLTTMEEALGVAHAVYVKRRMK